MNILKNLQSFDAGKNASIMTRFLKEKVSELGRDGIVVPISGGLDSSVIATLAVQAIGCKKVTGLLLPEKQGNPEASSFARLLAEHLHIKTRTIDITSPLMSFGAYNFILSRIPGRAVRETLVKLFKKGDNHLLRFNNGTRNRLVRGGVASFMIKQRVRLVATYYFAEERNLLVCGSAHKSEDLVGLYVKFGVDDAADVMLLKNLYRTQILMLGEFLGIPEEILGRTPNPDLIPGVTDKYKDILGIESLKLDMILVGLENKVSLKDIAKQAGVGLQDVNNIIDLVRATAHMRNPSMTPVLAAPRIPDKTAGRAPVVSRKKM
jgi:NAD+ synthase